MTDPKYIADRDKIAKLHSRNYPMRSGHTFSFKAGADWGYSRANSELENLKQLIEAKDAAWDVLEKHEALVIKALDLAVEALRIYAIDINGHKARETLTKIKTLIGEIKDNDIS